MTQMAEARSWAGGSRSSMPTPTSPSSSATPTSGAHTALIQDILLRRPGSSWSTSHRNADGRALRRAGADRLLPTWTPRRGLRHLARRPGLNPLVGILAGADPVRRNLPRPARRRQRASSPRCASTATPRWCGLPVASPDMPAARAACGERGIIEGGRDYRRAPVLAYAAGGGWHALADDRRRSTRPKPTPASAPSPGPPPFDPGFSPSSIPAATCCHGGAGRQRHEMAALQAERDAEARFRVVFEQAVGIALSDPGSGRFTDANPRLCGDPSVRSADELAGLSPSSHPPGRHRRERR